MGTTTETRITSTQAKDAIYKIHSVNSSASEIDGSVNRDRQTIVLLGDSITAGNNGSNQLFTQNIGQFIWGNALSGHKFDLLYNAGIGGDTSTQILARVETDVLSYNPSHCMFMCGMNDGATVEATINLKNNIVAIYEKLNKAGIYSFILTPTTRKNGHTKNQQCLLIGKWMVDYFADKPNCEVIDLCSAWIDPTNATGDPKNIMLRDDVHPSSAGGFYGGKTIAKHLSKWKDKYLLETSIYNSLAINTLGKNRLNNPLLTGTTGTLQGVTAGFVATSHRVYTSSGSCNASKENRDDGFGENQVLDITAIDHNSFSRLEVSSSGLLSAGDTVYASCEVTVSRCSNLARIMLALNIDNVSVALCFASADTSRKPITTDDKFTLTLVTGKYTLTTNSTMTGLSTNIIIASYFSGEGDALVKIGRVSMIKCD